MIPGVSRSGATIMGSMLLGVGRAPATEFSFFLAVPTMLAATVYDIYKNWSILSLNDFPLIATGFLFAFLSALVVVKTLIAFVSKNGFAPFAYYRIVIGTLMLIILLPGSDPIRGSDAAPGSPVPRSPSRPGSPPGSPPGGCVVLWHRRRSWFTIDSHALRGTQRRTMSDPEPFAPFIVRRLWHEEPAPADRWRERLRGVLRIGYAVVRDIVDGRLPLHAASLVYTTILSLVPLIALAFSVLKGFGVHYRFEELLMSGLAPLGREADDHRAAAGLRRQDGCQSAGGRRPRPSVLHGNLGGAEGRSGVRRHLACGPGAAGRASSPTTSACC